MTWLDETRSRAKAKQREWEKCKEEVRKAKERESQVRDQLTALQVLINAEQPNKAKAADAPVTQLSLATNTDTDGNKAEIVRAVIQEHGSTGLTPSQIRKFLDAKGFPASGNYLYAVLLRSKRTGRLIERNGRYYPPEQKEKAAS